MTAQVIELFPRRQAVEPVPPPRGIRLVRESPSEESRPSEDELIEEFLGKLKGQTLTDYRRMIGYGRQWLRVDSGFEVDLYEARTPHMEDWKRYLLETEELAAGTVRNRISAFISLFKYAMNEGYHTRNPAANVELPVVGSNIQYTGLTIQDVRRLTAYLPDCALRTRAIILILLFTGLRVSELCKARIEGLDATGDQVTLNVVRKGGRADQVKIPPRTHAVLHEYLDGRRSGPLILGEFGDAIARQVCWRIVRAVGDGALPHLTGKLHPHDFRHTYISGVVRLAGGDMSEAQTLAGHADPRNTARYRHALDREVSTTQADLEDMFGLPGGVDGGYTNP